MLTYAERFWLEKRQERYEAYGFYSIASQKAVFMEYWLTPDYRDAAEFEARVARLLALKMPLACRIQKAAQFIPSAEVILAVARMNIEDEIDEETTRGAEVQLCPKT